MSGVKNILEIIEYRQEADAVYGAAIETVSSNFGEHLKRLRKELSLTQQELANILEVTATYISKIENGAADAGLPMMIKLQAYLKDQSV